MFLEDDNGTRICSHVVEGKVSGGAESQVAGVLISSFNDLIAKPNCIIGFPHITQLELLDRWSNAMNFVECPAWERILQ